MLMLSPHFSESVLGSGLVGTLKFVALLALGGFATLGALFVLELLPFATVVTLAIKVVALALIASVALVLMAVLLHAGKRG